MRDPGGAVAIDRCQCNVPQDNPGFIDDSAGAAEDTVDGMIRLIEQLTNSATATSVQTIRLDVLVCNTVDRSGLEGSIPQLPACAGMNASPILSGSQFSWF